MDTFTDKLVLLFIFAGAVGLSLGMIGNYIARSWARFLRRSK